MMKQLISCVNYCHQNSIIHRDLKPENILLESNKDFNQIKVIDFGISLIQDSSKSVQESIGTPYYIAPEVWKKHYNKECDVWSCGVIMYIILSGTPPFNAPDDKQMKEKILTGKYSTTGGVWEAISDTAKDLIDKLLTYDPEARITAEAALQHPWITESATFQVDSAEASTALTALANFRAEEKIKQATCTYIASQLLSKKEKDSLGAIFKQLDANGDGKLSPEEIKDGYAKYFGQIMNDEQIMDMF